MGESARKLGKNSLHRQRVSIRRQKKENQARFYPQISQMTAD
jgi:hypothetical protein